MIGVKALCLALAFGVACSSGSGRVIVAAGTTLVDSGLIDAVADRYQESHPGTQLSIVGESTRLILELGRQGAADLLLVHAHDQEREFVADGYASLARSVMESRFIVVGPSELASEFRGLSVDRAFARVFNQQLTFVSRGDRSGTHDKEMSIWAGIGDPTRFSWYVNTGQGMGPTIQVADQRAGVSLAEHGAFLAAADVVSIVDLGVSPDGLSNPYTGYVVAGSDNDAAARAFLEWLVSPEGTTAILDANEALFGEVVYKPVAG